MSDPTTGRAADRVAVNAEIGRAFTSAKDWRQRFSLSLAVANGAGLLAFFNAKAGKAAMAADMHSPAVGWAFLAGLVVAGALPWLWSEEQQRMSALADATDQWVAAGEPSDKASGEKIMRAVNARYRFHVAAGWAEVISSVLFVGGAGFAVYLAG